MLRIQDASVTFPASDGSAVHALDRVNLDIAPNSIVVAVGASGCGKSTLLNIIAGLDRDYEGAIDLGPAKDGVTFIFQTPRLLPWRTLYENIALALPDGDPRHAEIPAMLDRVGLREAQNAYPEMLSLGMQRRAALARGFILEPKILLMDEPFVSLDDPTAASLRELLMDLWRRHPTTVIFVTHDRSEAIQLGTRILRLAPGQASVAQDVAVTLTDAQRHDRAAVLQEQSRIFAI